MPFHEEIWGGHASNSRLVTPCELWNETGRTGTVDDQAEFHKQTVVVAVGLLKGSHTVGADARA